ncbi:hypothetical protein, partial [Galactobacter sp.]|uniref:hypothetical protein n=1 Tax=Galactobacter sp. TaxID=2676125 RepID=UPI0025BFF30F
WGMSQATSEPVPKSALYLAVALVGAALVALLAPIPGAVSGLVAGAKGDSYFAPAMVLQRYWFEPQGWWAAIGFAVALLISLAVARGSASKLWTTIGCVLVYVAAGLVHEQVTFPGQPWGTVTMAHLHTVLLSDFSAWIAAAVAAVALFLVGVGSRFDPGRRPVVERRV